MEFTLNGKNAQGTNVKPFILTHKKTFVLD
jgi:hypothetical protein